MKSNASQTHQTPHEMGAMGIQIPTGTRHLLPKTFDSRKARTVSAQLAIAPEKLLGTLLCTQKDHTLVEYALAGMDNHLFVSKYQLELPKKEEMQRFIEEQIKEAGDGE